MPFTKPWRAFAAGDLVYGIHKGPLGVGRQNYLDKKFEGGLTIEHYAILNTEKKKKMAPAEELQSFVKALESHPKYGASIGGDDTNANVRMKDKGGLYWATTVGKYVHFVLDGLDIEAVVRKNFQGKNSDRSATDTSPKNRSITGAELRWIYRNRHLKNVQKYIQFWFAYEQVEPPWVKYRKFKFEDGVPVEKECEGAALWAQYVPRVTTPADE